MKYLKPLTLLVAAATLALTNCDKTPSTLLERALNNPSYLHVEERGTGVANTIFKDQKTGNLAYGLLRDDYRGTVVEYSDLNGNGKVDENDYFLRTNVKKGTDCVGSSRCLDDDCNTCLETACFTHYPETILAERVPLRAITTHDDPMKIYPTGDIDYITSKPVQEIRQIIECVTNTAQELNNKNWAVIDPNLLP